MNKEKLNQLTNLLKPHYHKIEAAAITIALVLSIVALCSSPSGSRRGDDRSVGEVLDSLTAMLPKGSTVIARFPESELADLYYLNSGVLYCFNGRSKMLEEMTIAGVTTGSIIDAKLSQDEKFIMLTVRDGKLDHLYRLNTANRNIVDMNKSMAVPDETKKEERGGKSEEKAPEVPQITEPLPEAAFAAEPTGAGHEVKKESAEPKKQAEPTNAPEVITIGDQ